MSSESVCQVARRWVDVGSFNTRLVARFMIFKAPAQNILGTSMYTSKHDYELGHLEQNGLMHNC
jgi:hypothetical protein